MMIEDSLGRQLDRAADIETYGRLEYPIEITLTGEALKSCCLPKEPFDSPLLPHGHTCHVHCLKLH